MTQSIAPQSRHRVLALLCLAALWCLIVVKALWLLLAATDLPFVSPIPPFTLAFVTLLVATLAFQTNRLTVALALSWIGVILGYAAAHVSGVVPGTMTDRIHEQFLYHWADIAYLVFAHVLFILRRTSTPAPTADAG